MMNLARPRAPSVSTVDIARVARDVVQLARRTRSDDFADIGYTGPEVVMALADAAQVRQVLWNLVRNAIQASAGTPVQVRLASEAKLAIVEVEDHGPGIPEEMRERVFEPFVTTRSKGVGIGLAVVKQIVDAHGGSVRVLPAQGGGTTFRIELPTGVPKA